MFFDNLKKIKSRLKDNLPFTILLVAVFVIFIVLNKKFVDLNFLPLHSIDEYAFHGSLLNMYDGLASLKPSLFFKTGFYSYGFLFFLYNFLLTLPFIVAHYLPLTIFIPRMGSALFAILSLVVVYKFAKRYLSSFDSFLFCLFASLIPAFWINGLVFHPDWMMTFFVLASLYAISLPLPRPWLGVVFFGLALSSKIQAVTFLPIFFLILFREEIENLNFKNFFSNSKKFLKSLVLMLAIFVVSNPYVLHPVGREAFIRAFKDNVESNATNHGVIGQVGFWEKILLVANDYFSVLLLFLIVALAVIKVYGYLKNKEKNFYGALSVVFLLNLFYLLAAVNKAWQQYYLAVMIVGILLLPEFICKLNHRNRQITLITLVLFQFITTSLALKNIAFQSYDRDLYGKQKVVGDFVAGVIADKVKKDSVILISPYTGFNFDKLGLDYRNVEVIYGPLSWAMIDQQANKDFSAQRYGSSAAVNYKKWRTKDFVILRKDDVYFNKMLLDNLADKKGYKESLDIISILKSGQGAYQLIAENSLVYIFKHY